MMPPATAPPKKRDWARISFYATLAALFLWAFVIESFLVLRTDHAARIPRLPAGCDGVRIVVASDWHVGSLYVTRGRAEQLAQRIAHTQPDLILLPGDFIAHGLLMNTYSMKDIAPTLRALPRAAPTYAVLGNHDHVNNTPAMVETPLREVGINTLFNRNQEVSLRDGKCKLRVVGIADDFVGVSSPRQALAGARENEVRIGLTHSPTIYPSVQQDLDVLVAGHSHGGVACVPMTKLCISHFSAWGSKWVKGTYQPDGFRAPLLITNGLGNSIYPLRFSSPAGFDVLTLRAGTGARPTLEKQ